MKTKARATEGLGNRIKRLRVRGGLSQADLGKKIGASQRLISSFEKEEVAPSPQAIVDLAGIFGVTTDELLGAKKTRASMEMDAETAHLWKKLLSIRSLSQRDRRTIVNVINLALRKSVNGSPD